MFKSWLKYVIALWFVSFLGLAGCAHNSRSSVDVPGIVNGYVNVDLKLNVPMLGGAPAMTRAEVEAMIEKKMKKLGGG